MSASIPLRTILLPNVELNMESVTVTDVFVKPGDRIEVGAALAAVETQKANIEVNAEEAGFVHEVFIAVGQEIGEKAPVCSLGDAPPAGGPVPAPQTGDAAAPAPVAAAAPPTPASAPAVEVAGKVRASPVARKVARDLGISLADVPPTGPAGRIMRRDVEAFAQKPAARAGAADKPVRPAAPTLAVGWTAFDPARGALIAQMETAARSIPMFSVSRLMDVTMLLRKQEGITMTHRLVACLGAALDQHRALLTTIEAGRYRIEEVAVAVAMDTKTGLLAPAVRNPHTLTLPQIADEVRLLKAMADGGRLKRADFERAPFALSNLGMFGVDQFQPFVFAGQCAVLGTGRATDAAAGRKVAWFTLTCDHRALDGAEAARFLQTLQDLMLKEDL